MGGGGPRKSCVGLARTTTDGYDRGIAVVRRRLVTMSPLQPTLHPPIRPAAELGVSPNSIFNSSESAHRLMTLLAIVGSGAVPGADPVLAGAARAIKAIAELQEAAFTTLQAAAQAMAEALGVRTSELLDFAEPHCKAVELRGSWGRMRRLDRVWGGPMLAEVESLPKIERRKAGALRYVAPASAPAHWVLTRGTARLDGIELALYASFQLVQGQELTLEPGAAVLLRRAPVHALMEAMQQAGLETKAPAQDGAGHGIHTPAGKLELDAQQRQAHVAGRRVRLTPSEVRTLEVLTRTPGQIVSRERLADALGVQPRAMDRIVVQLRDKLGDGLISTVYGAGYILETAPALITPSSEPS